MQRMGMIIGLKEEDKEAYLELHRNVWPDILEQLRKSHVTNYSIFLKEPENLLFGYWEYAGDDFDADMKNMADDPRTQDWWTLCGPKQQPLESRQEGEWWAMMESIFHMD